MAFGTHVSDILLSIEDCDRSSFATRMALVNKPKNILILPCRWTAETRIAGRFVLLLFRTLMHRCNNLWYRTSMVLFSLIEESHVFGFRDISNEILTSDEKERKTKRSRRLFVKLEKTHKIWLFEVSRLADVEHRFRNEDWVYEVV